MSDLPTDSRLPAIPYRIGEPLVDLDDRDLRQEDVDWSRQASTSHLGQLAIDGLGTISSQDPEATTSHGQLPADSLNEADREQCTQLRRQTVAEQAKRLPTSQHRVTIDNSDTLNDTYIDGILTGDTPLARRDLSLMLKQLKLDIAAARQAKSPNLGTIVEQHETLASLQRELRRTNHLEARYSLPRLPVNHDMPANGVHDYR